MMKKFNSFPPIVSGKVKEHRGRSSDFDKNDFNEIDRIFRLYRSWGWSPVLVSDDASAATDSIAPDLSSRVADLTWRSDSPGRPEFKDTWTGILNYGLHEVKQTNGQLMGDRRSFPTLCLIHCAVKEYFLKKYGLSPTNSFYRVNGDDGVVILPKHLVEQYFEFVSELWQINRAKTYVSDKIFSFNSKLWRISTRELIPITRFKLIDCIDKSGDPCNDPLLFNRVASDCAPYARQKAWEWFCSNERWGKILKQATTRGLNWFLPRVCGGLGLTQVGPDRLYITPLQKTMIVEAFRGSTSYIVGNRAHGLWQSQPRYITRPKKLGNSKEEPPIVRNQKPENKAGKLYLPRLPTERTWKSVEDELQHLETAGIHFCGGGDCDLCFQQSH